MQFEKRSVWILTWDPKITNGSQNSNKPLERNKVEMQIEKRSVWDSEVGTRDNQWLLKIKFAL